jgi:hypothetical protein
MSSHPPTRAYAGRRTKEGLSKKEIIRCLKRYVARQVYPHLRPGAGAAARPANVEDFPVCPATPHRPRHTSASHGCAKGLANRAGPAPTSAPRHEIPDDARRAVNMRWRVLPSGVERVAAMRGR